MIYIVFKKKMKAINSAKRLLYTKYRNKMNSFINNTKNNYIKNEICKNYRNPKKVWDIVNTLCGKIINSIDEIILKYFPITPNVLVNVLAHKF